MHRLLTLLPPATAGKSMEEAKGRGGRVVWGRRGCNWEEKREEQWMGTVEWSGSDTRSYLLWYQPPLFPFSAWSSASEIASAGPRRPAAEQEIYAGVIGLNTPFSAEALKSTTTPLVTLPLFLCGCKKFGL